MHNQSGGELSRLYLRLDHNLFRFGVQRGASVPAENTDGMVVTRIAVDGEDAAIAALRESYPHLVDHLRSGRDAIVWRGQQEPIDYVEAERAWEIARAAISSGLYKTVILDELNPTVDLELLPVEPIVQTLLRKPAETEVIITGRCKNPPAYFDLASIHSEMVCHKHYAEQGVDLKRGVDY